MMDTHPAIVVKPSETPKTLTSADVLRAIETHLGNDLLVSKRVGSRVICNPPPTDTDEDWLLLVRGDQTNALFSLGFGQDGSPEFYTGSDVGNFRSYRLGNLNLITTPDYEFFNRFVTATYLAKRFNLLAKADRIALFQVVLYGVSIENLEHVTYAPMVHDVPTELALVHDLNWMG